MRGSLFSTRVHQGPNADFAALLWECSALLVQGVPRVPLAERTTLPYGRMGTKNAWTTWSVHSLSHRRETPGPCGTIFCSWAGAYATSSNDPTLDVRFRQASQPCGFLHWMCVFEKRHSNVSFHIGCARGFSTSSVTRGWGVEHASSPSMRVCPRLFFWGPSTTQRVCT